jgi:hypothetical protein
MQGLTVALFGILVFSIKVLLEYGPSFGKMTGEH